MWLFNEISLKQYSSSHLENKIEKSLKEQNNVINDINTKIEEIGKKLENAIKEIDTIKKTIKNLSTNNQNKKDKCDDKKK